MPSALFLSLAILFTTLSLRYQQRNAGAILLLLAAGVFAWSLLEYFLHRYVFHWTQVSEPWKSLASGLHMAHHRSSDQADLIVAPPVVAILFGGLVYLIFAAICRSWSAAALIESGLFTGYVAYEWVHYGAHRFKWKKGFGKYLQQYHLRHHFKNPNKSFGVTSPLWDYVFKTL